MKNKQIIIILVLLIICFSIIATSFGIFSDGGTGSYNFESIRGNLIKIYGQGIYKHMSADVAIQGIAQDFITLFLGIPVLLISLVGTCKGSLRSRFVLTGSLGYFFVTYLFYTAMAMYNYLFLIYVILLSLSFFSLLILILSFDLNTLKEQFQANTPNRFAGGFLVFTSVMIALLWLSVIIPPLADGSVYPVALEHYTTLIVQGFDLGLLLPVSFLSGILLIKGRPVGFLAGISYIVFLTLLMTALIAKIIAMAINGVNVIPSVFIIPAVTIIAYYCTFLLINSIIKK